ncbi:MAG: NADPH-dependent assimilatory sulfite reductase hemoprotein subunit [Vulcanimicrobiaceae bacterium]
MAQPSKVEGIKAASNGLRGTIAKELAAPTDNFGESDLQLLKFHGIYQQEDRDVRLASRGPNGEKAPKAYSFMLRTKSPGGYVPGPLYLALANLSETHGNGTMRVTTRQGFQLHGVHKSDLKEVIATINETLGSTLGACGDINRNVMAPAAPFATKAYTIARETAHTVAELLTPRTAGYYEIWQDGEVAYSSETESDPLYKDVYLPRKFKVTTAVAGDNSVDLFTNDLAIVPILSDVDVLLGYDLYVGGGLGMTHRKPDTFPRLAEELGFVEAADLLGVVRAIVEVQRDYGDRTNRKHARLKYTIADRGLAWFKSEVERYAGTTIAPFRPLPAWEHRDYLGWHEQGDGRLFVGVHIENGRVKDGDALQLKSALHDIVSRFDLDLVLTPQHNALIVDIPREARGAIEAILAERGVRPIETISLLERHAMACPALPTCGLALAEAERALPTLVDTIERRLVELGLASEPISIRMTGCPNGCARPYMSEIGLVGVSAEKYNVHLGGRIGLTHLNRIYREAVPTADLVPLLDELFVAFKRDRHAEEAFGAFCDRVVMPVPEPALA